MNKIAATVGILLGLTAGVTLATPGTETGLRMAMYVAN